MYQHHTVYHLRAIQKYFLVWYGCQNLLTPPRLGQFFGTPAAQDCLQALTYLSLSGKINPWLSPWLS